MHQEPKPITRYTVMLSPLNPPALGPHSPFRHVQIINPVVLNASTSFRPSCRQTSVTPCRTAPRRKPHRDQPLKHPRRSPHLNPAFPIPSAQPFTRMLSSELKGPQPSKTSARWTLFIATPAWPATRDQWQWDSSCAASPARGRSTPQPQPLPNCNCRPSPQLPQLRSPTAAGVRAD